MSGRAGTVLVLTVSPWHEPKRLRRQLAELLAKDGPVIYVTLPHGMRKPRRSADEVDAGVRTLALAGPPLPLRWLLRNPWLRSLYEARLAARLAHRLGRATEIAAVLTFTPLYPRLLDRFPGARHLYVANDDHPLLSANAEEAERLRLREAELLARTDRVVTVSEGIARRLRASGKPVDVILPGHDCAVLPVESFHAERIARSVCFLGYIDWRVDFALLEALLEREYHVALIGPVVGTQAQIDALRARHGERLAHLPAMAAEDAPPLLARYEVLAMPYRFRSAEQAALMELPNKLFVYFSALRPVVTTDMPNLRLVEPGLVYRSDSTESFIANCARAVADDSIGHARRRAAIALENTWESRRARLRAMVAGCAPAIAAVT